MEAAHFKLSVWKDRGKPLKISGYRPMSARLTVRKVSRLHRFGSWSDIVIFKILVRILNNLGCIFWNLKHEFLQERNRSS
jgi:hypothetical protein